MELKLYNRVKRKLLHDFSDRAENHDRDFQKQVENFASRQNSGVPQPISRKIQNWLSDYNKLQSAHFSLRYYQILALYFTEHVLAEKRAGKDFLEQKSLVYWMATGSGKTLLMHLNILQYIEHIGGGQAFDELQLILTTPGVNLIEQHERELGEVVVELNRLYNNRIKLTVATTGALLNKEDRFFNMPESKRVFRLVLVDEGHIGLSSNGDAGAFKRLRHDLLKPENSFLFEYSATYHGIAEKHVREYEEQIVYDYNYYRFFKDGYGKDYALQSLADDRFADLGQSEGAFFETTFETLSGKLQSHEHLTVSQAHGSGALPFAGRFPDKPLLAFMGNTVEDPKDEGKGKDEVSDIRKFIVWLAHLSPDKRESYQSAFNGQHSGKLTLTRSPGITDEIWLSWGDGQYWGVINVGNGDRFFNGCEEHPQLHNGQGELMVTLAKAKIVHTRYHFASIDDPVCPINVLVGSRKFAEGWNCFRLSIIGLINLGSSKGNKIIQIFGRGVRLKGLKGDGKRQNMEHSDDYAHLVSNPSDANQLRCLETLNVYSLNRSWLETFLKALDKDLPVISGPYSVDVMPSVVKVGRRKKVGFADYQDKLQAFKVGKAEFDSPLRIIYEPTNHGWKWEYVQGGKTVSGELSAFEVRLDYRSDRLEAGRNIVHTLTACLDDYSMFLSGGMLHERMQTWVRQQRVQLYLENNDTKRLLSLPDLLPIVNQVLYDHELGDRSWAAVERLLSEVQRDLLEKVFHKVRYDIDKRQYRLETVSQSVGGQQGDFIERYSLSYEFEKDIDRRAFELLPETRESVEAELTLDKGQFHIYEPLFGDGVDGKTEKTLKKHKMKRIGISPDKLNQGERKFLRDILTYVDANYSRDRREFYLMRNVESLRSIGLYLEGETRSFFPDFVLWIVDDKKNKTTIALFDPKGQTGIVNDADLGFSGTAMNEKVAIGSSGQLSQLAKDLQQKYTRKFAVHSFILLRDSSPLGKWTGSAPSDKEMQLAESMIQKGVLRLDWHLENELGQSSVPLSDGRSYLSRIFERLNVDD